MEKNGGIMDTYLNFVGIFSLNNSNISRLICGFEETTSVLISGGRFGRWLRWREDPIQILSWWW